MIDAFKSSIENALKIAYEAGWNGCASAYTDVLERKEAINRLEQADIRKFVLEVQEGVLSGCAFKCVESDSVIGVYLKLRERRAQRLSWLKLFAVGAGSSLVALLLRAVLT